MTEDELRAVVARHPIEGPPHAMREAFAALAAEAPAELTGVERGEAEVGGVRCVTLTPEGADGPPVLHLHGGGYVFGSPETHEGLGAALARAAGARVILPAYRLAPERLWPAQREDALAVCAAMRGPFDLSGDSAGGHLALVACAAGARPRRLVLFSPNTLRDYGRAPSRRRCRDEDAANDHAQDDRLARMAFGRVDGRDPDQTLRAGAAARLPETYLDVGTGEVLLDDALHLVRLAAEAGVRLELRLRPGFHLIQLFASRYAPGADSLARAGAWLRR